MTERGTPVVILFIIAIGIMLYNYIGQYIEVNENLRAEIHSKDIIIKKKTQENQAMATLISHLWYRQTGERIPDTWIEIPKDKNSPIH